MLKGFIDLNRKKVDKETAFRNPGAFGVTEATLRMIADEQVTKNDTFRVTELLRGPRMHYLLKTRDWYVDPQDAAFRILGTGAHAPLSEQQDKSVKELRLEHQKITGQMDHFDVKRGILTDYKITGSYKVRLALGLQKTTVKDETARNGYRNVFKPTGDPDMWEWEMQVNMYRILLEKNGHGPVNKMQIQAIVRDGGTIAAKTNGIPKNIYLIPVRPIPDEQILQFFIKKKIEMQMAMKNGSMPRLCNEIEAWNGRRCKGYCPVAEYCKSNGDNDW